MIKKNKVILILLCIALIFCITGTSCYASNFNIEFSYNNKDYNLTIPEELAGEGYNYFIVANSSGIPIKCVYYRKDNSNCFYVEKNTDGNYHFLVCNNDCLFLLNYKDNGFVWHKYDRTGYVMSSSDYIIYSTRDICYTDDTIFFRNPPLQQGIQVVEITQVEEIPKAIAETMKTIIPIGLLVLSIFLMIYLIRLVILRAI